MRTDKLTREKLRFHPDNNRHRGDYNTDWGSGVKYVAAAYGLAVGEGGAIHLTNNFVRDPDSRAHLRDTYGVDLRMDTELAALCTTDGRKIPKNTLRGQMFLVQGGRVYDVSQRIETPLGFVYATWYTVESAPSVNFNLNTRERNKERENAWHAERREMFLKADAAIVLEEGNVGGALGRYPWNKLGQDVKSMNISLSGRESEFYIALGHHRRQKTDWSEFMLNCTGDFREYPYLCLA